MPIQEWDPPRTIRFGSMAGGARMHEFDVRESDKGGATVRVRDWGLDDSDAAAGREAWRTYLERLRAVAEAG